MEIISSENKESITYHKSIDQITDEFNTKQEEGLSESEAKKRLDDYGPNQLKQESAISPWEILVEQFKNIIVILLIIASGISFVIGDVLEGVAVLAVIIINAIFGFFTEYKAEKSVQALKEMVTTKAKVIRDGSLTEVDADKIVPGDLLVLDEGDKVTADGRLIKADNLAIAEAVLTGEAEPVDKNTDTLKKEDIPLAERSNMVFMGSSVTRGNGVAVVTGTATDTQMGQISDMLHETESEATPLEERLDKMGKSLIVVTLVIAAIVSVVGIFIGREVMEMIETGVALAIAAVPEGLPAVATITLAIGMKKMAQYNALVKRLPAVETLGSTTVICTDKTGTLTENQMTLKEIYLGQDEDVVEITGTGYKPEGEFKIGEETINPQENEKLSLILKGGTLCSNAVVKEEDSLWNVVGDPTEGALVTAAQKAGFDREEMQHEGGYEKLEEIPFTSDAKYMAVSYQTPEEKELVVAKGAPSVIIDMCDQISTQGDVKSLAESTKENLREKNEAMAQKGLRVLALAYQKSEEQNSPLESSVKSGLIFLGFVGMVDPPRPDVKEAITEASRAGVKTVMITGDQRDTAQAIGRKVGIADKNKGAVTGEEIEGLSLANLIQKIKNNSIFSRVSPENKLDIIKALNEEDEITAMTGDGVNDAPALKRANIGVAMGQRGTAVAREASDMILLDDNFATIVKAVRQGRVIFDNIQKFIYYLFSCNLSEILLIFLGIILQVPIPLLTLQILWLNLVTDVFPALTLAWEPPEEEVMEQPPRNPTQGILTADFKKRIGLHALIVSLGPLLVYLYALNIELPLATSRTMSFVTLAFVQLFHVFDARREEGLGFDKTMFENIYLWGAIVITISLQLVAVYLPFFQPILNTVPLPWNLWMIVLSGSIIPIIIIQLSKLIFAK
ncbi:cation transport ATPase [Halobacteroides halobius DSM 5150]|uniref:P-type Ca(2+) transporter n=1 Tax=Halobacteroides halobius (strain ATCC 35273 / DSM 5150 / MD-1) TaxID=748449 RepID=L0K9B4_HALHC|nr:HAD-IC family P-type ATPase [Halobacteroides halobius]AGB40703.1 cation transport ATPase [Halobacteroides halobius DSM 5150]